MKKNIPHISIDLHLFTWIDVRKILWSVMKILKQTKEQSPPFKLFYSENYMELISFSLSCPVLPHSLSPLILYILYKSLSVQEPF